MASNEPSPDRGPKAIAILQSNYIPWKGYFDIMAAVDEFLIFDEVQFTRRDWRNRNRVVVNGALLWLTIPVQTKGRFDAPINEITVSDGDWGRRHWQTVAHAYRGCPFFKQYADLFERTYVEASELQRLTEINELFLRTIAGVLELKTTILRTDPIPRTSASPTERLVEICRHRQARIYLSGPAAKAYIEPERFAAAGIDLRFANYEGYPAYDQGMEPFVPGVSILDVLFRFGTAARSHLKSLRGREHFWEPA